MAGDELRSFSVDGLEKIGEGGMGTIFRINDEQIIKVYNPDITLAEVKEKKKYAREIFVNGVPTMISFEIVAVGERYGIIFELLACDTVAKALRNDPSLTTEYGPRMGQLLKQVHSIDMPENALPRFKDRLVEWIAIMERDFQSAPRVVRAMRQVVEAIPDANRVLHCDFHEGNVMVSGDELLLIDIDEVCLGNPLYDLAFCYANHVLLSHEPNTLMKSVGIEPMTARRMYRQMMAEYYHTDDTHRLKQIDRTLLVLALLTYALSPARIGDSVYATKRNIGIVLHVVHPAFHIMWSLCRLLHRDVFSDMLPTDLSV